MNSEKVKEIKKDIECCTSKIGCEECSLMPIMTGTNCRNELLKNCLTLINELESENVRLTLERDVLVKKDCRSPKTKESIVAPIYFLPNTQTPEMVLKLGEKNLVCQFAERVKERLKEKVNSDNVDAFVECSLLMGDLLKEFVEE